MFQIGIQPWNVGTAITRRALCRPVAPCALCSRDNGAWERESRYDTEKLWLLRHLFRLFVVVVVVVVVVLFRFFFSLFLSCLKSLPNICTLLKVLFTWRWDTPGRWGNPLRWGNTPVHTISQFNLITFTGLVGWPATFYLTYLGSSTYM